MKFNFPEAHMTSEYGCFDNLDLFWEAFHANVLGLVNSTPRMDSITPEEKDSWILSTNNPKPTPTASVYGSDLSLQAGSAFLNTPKPTPSPNR
jgi:hypothetical protein